MVRFLFFILFFLSCVSYAYSSAVVEAKKNQMRQQPPQPHNSQPNPSGDNQNFFQDKQEAVVEEVVGLGDVWKELEFSSEVWRLMIDNEPKRITVENYIKLYAKKGVIIRQSPQSYVDLIDDMAFKNPDILKNPFFEVLRFVAIVEYDFDNGIDRDIMAQQLLGPDVYRSNRQRLGLE